MAALSAVLFKTEEETSPGSSSIFEPRTGGEKSKSRAQLIENKIDFLESMAGKVSNRRSRRWLNDRLLFELVPRLNAEEIRGLFAPPPWGDDVPASALSMTNVSEWDCFRNIDMDKEVRMIQGLETQLRKQENSSVSADKAIALSAWHRIDRRTRQVLRRNCLPDLIQSYERCIMEFINTSDDEDAMVLCIQDPFRRLVLHGVCEFYDLVSATHAGHGKAAPPTTTIRRKRAGSQRIPPGVTLTGFMKAAKLPATS